MTKTLVVAPAWVGDVMISQPLLHGLAQGGRVDVLATPWTIPLLQRMPDVQHIHPLAIPHGQLQLNTRYQLGKSLREFHYDRAIVLPNSWKSALIPWFARIPLRTGFRGEYRYGLLNDIRDNPKQWSRIVDRFYALGLSKSQRPFSCPHPVLQSKPEQVQATLQALGLKIHASPVTVLCPGAEYGPAKRWPYFVELAQARLKQGDQVMVLGSPRDEALGISMQDSVINLIGKTNLAQAVDILSLADRVVANDSGLMHVAAALGKPVIALYGPTDPGFAPPLSHNSKILTKSLPCSPCRSRECPLTHHNCMRLMPVEEVLEAMEKLV